MQGGKCARPNKPKRSRLTCTRSSSGRQPPLSALVGPPPISIFDWQTASMPLCWRTKR
jgi:hypothetical protein